MTDAELRDLDAEIHRKVFGGRCERGQLFCGPVDWIAFNEDKEAYSVPRYSTDRTAAQSVIDRLWATGEYYEIVVRRYVTAETKTRAVMVTIASTCGGRYCAGAVSAHEPRAICLAARDAVRDGGRDADSYKLNPGGQRA